MESVRSYKFKMKIILETERLYLRELESGDYASLCRMLKDPEVMYAYEHAFDDDEAHMWLEKQIRRYREDGFGLWAVILKRSGELIGQCGLTYQDCNGRRVVEVGYLFIKEFWHKGYATEAAAACKNYAFDVVGADEVCSIIRENNTPSRNVAERNGMLVTDTLTKYYYGTVMPHLVYSVKKRD